MTGVWEDWRSAKKAREWRGGRTGSKWVTKVARPLLGGWTMASMPLETRSYSSGRLREGYFYFKREGRGRGRIRGWQC